MIFWGLKRFCLGGLVVLGALVAVGAGAQNRNSPTLFVVGDVQPELFRDLFDPAHLKLQFSPARGRTMRAYIGSGDWQRALNQMKPGDLVWIACAANARGAAGLDDATRTLPGVGDGTFDYLAPGTTKAELVHSYGWYVRELVVDTINHGAVPILYSPPGGMQRSALAPKAVEPAAGEWTRAIAVEQRVALVDLSASEAEVAESGLRAGLEALEPDPLGPYLKRAGS